MVKALRASALVLLLACSTRAGIMQNEVRAPASASTTQENQTAAGIIQNGEPASFTETALSLLESLLALF